MRTTYAKYENPDYFDDNEHCREHNDYRCIACEEASRTGDSKALARITYDNDVSLENKLDAEERFTHQVEFIQTALDLPEEKLNKMKVKDLGKMMHEATEQITVGKMKVLLRQGKPKSLTGKFFFGLFKRFL